MKYKVGDKVRVRSDLKVNHDYGNITLLDGFMKDYRGEIAEVISVSKNYLLKIDDLHYSFYFSEEMIQGLAEETPKRKFFNVYDTVKHDVYGIGTVIQTGNILSRVDFDEWNKQLMTGGHIGIIDNTKLTLVKAYTGGEAD